MTVKELIDRLKMVQQDLIVIVEDGHDPSDMCEITTILPIRNSKKQLFIFLSATGGTWFNDL